MSDFLMPSLGADMASGELVEWRVRPGDRVEKGQVIAVVETNKGAIEVEVFQSGVVEALYEEPGTRLPVGAPMARIDDGRGLEAGEGRPEAASMPEPEPEPKPKPRSEPPAGTPAPALVRFSPAARRRARELGVDPAGLRGSGPGGAVLAGDVEKAAGARPVAAPAEAPPTRPAGFDRDEMRQAIAAAMTRSKREIPHYYLNTTVDLKAAHDWLTAYNRDRPPESRLVMAALLAKAAARALRKCPDLNGHFHEQGFQPADSVHLGMAIHLRGGGLIAPALLDADRLNVPDLMVRLRDLIDRARGGGLRSSEVTAPTATLTALGERGVDTVYGVIHPPQVAMIGFGRVRQRPVVVGDGLAARPAVDVSLAADHRVCDGHLGARFLNRIEQDLQQPEAL